MKFDKILILGSTYLTELGVEKLKDLGYNLVGCVRNKKSPVPGNITLPDADFSVDHDIALSIQYNKLIQNPKNVFNFHTGILPEYGGADILRHTINNKEREQGITFHKMGAEYDNGPIISKITYPVFDTDTVESLYLRQCSIAADFICSCVKLLSNIPEDNIDKCLIQKPKIYKRSKKSIIRYREHPMNILDLERRTNE